MDSSLPVALGGLGLFLLGMVVMTGGLRDMAGDSIRKTIARFTKSPASGVATGAVITALIQSSSATTVTAVGFAGAGLLTLSQSLGIIFGANIGTTITGWIVAIFGFKLKLDVISLPLILVGTLIHLFTKNRWSAFGLAIAGFGLVFVGIDGLQEGMSGMTALVTPETFPPDTWPGRALLVLLGIVITLVTQSSSAGVAMALTAVNAGALSFPQAAAMVIGFDVGTTVTAGIAGLSGSVDARRVGLAHVIYNLMTGVGAFFLLTPYVWFCDRFVDGGAAANPELALVGFHTCFNALGVIVALPFTDRFAKLIERLIPERSDEVVRRLDRALYENPSIAILASQRALVDLTAQVLRQMHRDFGSPEPPGDDDLAWYARVRKTFGIVLEYMREIPLRENQPALRVQLQHQFLSLDHLRRLTHRCEESAKLATARDVPRLSNYADKVESEIDDLLVALERPLSERDQQSARKLFKGFADSNDDDRQFISSGVASGSVSPDDAIAQLDALRWLRRVSYHLWRIVRHLQHAEFEPKSGDVVMSENTGQ